MNRFKFSIWTFCIVIFFITYLNCTSQDLPPENIQKEIKKIQNEIEEIRGLKYKQDVKVENQSLDEFGKYLDKMLEKQIPEELGKNYGKIVKKLGLYRGPEIKDFRGLAKLVMQSQAAAYYDPTAKTFFVVMPNLPAQMLNALYAHELYHGLQDQYYDLDSYVLSQSHQKLNDDELLARQAVVEGEATYIMTLWSMKNLFGRLPDSSMLQMAVKMQAQLDMDKMLEMLKSGALPQPNQVEMEGAIKALDKIPRFLLENLIGAYLKGMGFIFEIQKQGWEKVQILYSQPPVSSEQILHPEKWLANEIPQKFEWPDFKNIKLFRNWKLLEKNTIGELQWRVIFAEHEMADVGKKASAGWNGDSFAVLENQNSKDLLLLIYTSWDSGAEAKEFHSAYQILLKKKYPGDTEYVQTDLMDNNVLIIEGGNAKLSNKLIDFLHSIKLAPLN